MRPRSVINFYQIGDIFNLSFVEEAPEAGSCNRNIGRNRRTISPFIRDIIALIVKALWEEDILPDFIDFLHLN